MNPFRKETFSSIIREVFNNQKRLNPHPFQAVKTINQDEEDTYDEDQQPNHQKEATKKKKSSLHTSIKQLGTMTIKDNQNFKAQKNSKPVLRNTYKKNTLDNSQEKIKKTSLNKQAKELNQEATKIEPKEVQCKYFCGCGFFSNKDDSMKVHISKTHDRRYIKGSSHALTICGNLVFAWPQQNQVPKNYKMITNSQTYYKLQYIVFKQHQLVQTEENYDQKISCIKKAKIKKNQWKDKPQNKIIIQQRDNKSVQHQSKKQKVQQNRIQPPQLQKKRRNVRQEEIPLINLLGKQEELLGKQEELLGKQEELLGKQEELLGKQEELLGKQEEQAKSTSINNNNQHYVYSQEPRKRFNNSHCQNYLCLKNCAVQQSHQNLIDQQQRQKKLFQCGKCGNRYQRQFFFKKHILTICLILNHENSSHHLIKKDQSNWNFTQNLIPLIPEVNDLPQQVEKLVQMTNQQYWSFQLDSQVGLNEQNQEAFCSKCQKNFSNAQSYATHIMGKHVGIVPKGSSHILIRLIRNNIRQSLLMPIVSKSQFLQCCKYFCPCKVEVELSRLEFVNHVIKRHRGKTPLMRMAGRD